MLKIPKHRNVICLYASGERDGHHVLVMERPQPGMDLRRFIHSGTDATPLRSSVAKFIFRQILTAVIHCHASGVVHGDLKPSNVLVEVNTGRAILIDFGSSDELHSDQFYYGVGGMSVVVKASFSLPSSLFSLHFFLSVSFSFLPLSLSPSLFSEFFFRSLWHPQSYRLVHIHCATTQPTMTATIGCNAFASIPS